MRSYYFCVGRFFLHVVIFPSLPKVMDYERVNERLQEKLGSLTDAQREMTTKVDAANADLRQAKVATNEEKSAKIFAERRLKEQAKRLEELEAELGGEQAAHEKHVDEYKQLCKKLSDTLEAVSYTHLTLQTNREV